MDSRFIRRPREAAVARAAPATSHRAPAPPRPRRRHPAPTGSGRGPGAVPRRRCRDADAGPPHRAAPRRPDRATPYIRLSMFDTRPRFEDVRRNPDWWEDLAPSRAGLKPRFEDEDPRCVGAELGLLPPPKHPTQPPQQEDFEALATALRAAQESPATVRLGTDRRGRPAMVFSFPFDELLNLAVKRLPGRRFDWETREWTVPCMEHTAPEVAEMLACFPRVAVAPAVHNWLSQAAGWHGIAAVWDRGYGPRLALREIAGERPDWIEQHLLQDEEPNGGWLLVPLDAETAALARDQEGLE